VADFNSNVISDVQRNLPSQVCDKITETINNTMTDQLGRAMAGVKEVLDGREKEWEEPYYKQAPKMEETDEKLMLALKSMSLDPSVGSDSHADLQQTLKKQTTELRELQLLIADLRGAHISALDVEDGEPRTYRSVNNNVWGEASQHFGMV
jgi:hypothetical protein